MTDYLTTWDKILRSIRRDDDFGPVCMVNVYELTEHLDTLYTKIAELERRLDKEEEYRQEQNDRRTNP